MSKHKPGPEFNALIATEVMRWKQHSRNTIHWVSASYANEVGYDVRAIVGEWNPSYDIADAWEVWEELERLLGPSWRVRLSSACVVSTSADGQMSASKYYLCACFRGNDVFSADADTAPMAICLAALQAVQAAKGE